jgi:amino acid adenylation domain-containing protein
MLINWPDIEPVLSGVRRPPPDTRGVYEQVANSAARHASVIALAHGDATLTYAQLMDRVHEMQGRFAALGVPPGSAVVVQLPRGIEYVATVLATLAHGCHFVPVTETEPRHRLAAIVDRVDAAAHVVLSRAGRAAVSPLGSRGSSRLEASRYAYIMHTSGSTGLPKGAALPMAALTNLLSWYGDQLQMTPDSRFAQLTRPSFDISLPEIFLPLVHGGRMIIPTRPIDGGLIPVTEYLIEQRVTILQLVPTLLRPFMNLLAAVPPMAARLRSVRTIVCLGETLPDRLRQAVARVLPAVALVNSYGPTEACVAVTWHRCSQLQEALPDIIGAPAPNVDLYVMSDDLEPVPAGAVGELWIGGIQVADGYVGAREETQRRFATRGAHPASPADSDRVYRTGDLVRALSDGTLEFIGRRDRQVQLRGVRVEIGEIEAAVRETGLCDELRVTAVAGPGDSTADSLACFVTPATVDTGELEKQVRSRLPQDRWPRRFHALPAMPATANGKVNEKALAAIARRLAYPANAARLGTESRAPEAQEAFVAPADQVLREALANLIGRLPAPEESLHEIDIDSLGRLELQVAVADRGYVLSQEISLATQATIGEIASGMSLAEKATTTLSAANPRDADAAALRDRLRKVFDEACEGGTDFLVLQSSLPDFKGVTVHDALSMLLSEIDRVSQATTIALPAYTLSYIASRHVDLTRDPSESGMAATHVARAIGGLRTRHPAYSFVVVGPDAQALAEIDWTERSAFGDDSIFGWISARKSKYLLFATQAYAQVHRSEHLAQVPYHSYMYAAGTITDRAGRRKGGAYVYARDIPGSCDADCFGVSVDAMFALGRKATTFHDLGMCEAAIIDVRAFDEIVVPALRAEPYALIRPEKRERAMALVRERAAGDQDAQGRKLTRSAGHSRAE